MYGKLFTQMYDGTLATRGPWQALVTFQQLIILADRHGCVDMTAEAISRRTTIPIEVVEIGLQALAQPDPDSRSPAEDGRRIVPISDSRPWGWRIVNYDHYRRIRSEEERREYHRQYMRNRRGNGAAVNQIVKLSTGGDQCQPIAVSSKSQKLLSSKLDGGRPNGSAKDEEMAVLEFLNEKTGRRFEPVDANLRPITVLLRQGFSVDDVRAVIEAKIREWGASEKMAIYLRPKTLFNLTNFANYQGEIRAPRTLARRGPAI